MLYVCKRYIFDIQEDFSQESDKNDSSLYEDSYKILTMMIIRARI